MADGAVQKVAVVRDRQQRAAVVAQPLLKPDHRVKIEVVGGFIQQQQVRTAHERARQLQAHAPAAGKRVQHKLQFARIEPESVHQARGTAARGIAADVLVCFVQPRERVAVILLMRMGEPLFQCAQRRVAVDDVFDRCLCAGGNILRHVGDG